MNRPTREDSAAPRAAMARMVPRLPMPLAVALHTLLEEDEARSADEIAELVTAVVEYVGGIAAVGYLCSPAVAGGSPEHESLNGWMVQQLAKGQVSAGVWARWAQAAVPLAGDALPAALGSATRAQSLDDPDSALRWLLAFRNEVMHGGFVAPLPRIRTANAQLLAWLTDLESLVTLDVQARGPEGWFRCQGLRCEPLAHGAACVPEAPVGAVFLVDPAAAAPLRIDPAVHLDTGDGALMLQHHWGQCEELFEAPHLRAWKQRYALELQGDIPADPWRDAARRRLPPRGLVPPRHVVARLMDALGRPGVTALCGPVGSGRTTLLLHLDAMLQAEGRALAILPVLYQSPRADPEVLARWAERALETATAPAGATALPVLAVDDAHWVGTGLHADKPTAGCLAAVRQHAAVLLVHPPSQAPPVAADRTVMMPPWPAADSAAWGLEAEALERVGGHAECLADPVAGPENLAARVRETCAGTPHGDALLRALREGRASAVDLAERTGLFTPRVELSLRSLLDHLLVEEAPAPSRVPGAPDAVTQQYGLHPAVRAILAGGES